MNKKIFPFVFIASISLNAITVQVLPEPIIIDNSINSVDGDIKKIPYKPKVFVNPYEDREVRQVIEVEEVKKVSKDEEIVKPIKRTIKEDDNLKSTKAKSAQKIIKNNEYSEQIQKEDSLEQKQEIITKKPIVKISEDLTPKKSKIIEELESLPTLESSIGFLQNNYSTMNEFEFEKSKEIINNRISQDARFDSDYLKSTGMNKMNKKQYIDFIIELKTAISER